MNLEAIEVHEGERVGDGIIRLSICVDPALNERIRDTCERDGKSMGEVIRKGVFEMFEREDQAKLAPPTKKRETLKQRQERFLKALANQFHVSHTCEFTGIPLADVKAWQEDENFLDKVAESQEHYIESIEKELVNLSRQSSKKNPLPLITFLNSHHPAYGRLKGEILAKVIGVLIGKFHKAVEQFTAPEVAAQIHDRMREIAARKVGEFTD